MMLPFNEVVRQWRLERGLTQEELARRARVPRPNLCAVECGKRDVSLSTLRALAVGLGIQPGILADGVPPGADVGPAAWSRRRLERIADAVVSGQALPNRHEQTVADLLRQVMASRLRAGRPARGSGVRVRPVRKAAWVRLKMHCPPQVLRSLLERVDGRRRLAA